MGTAVPVTTIEVAGLRPSDASQGFFLQSVTNQNLEVCVCIEKEQFMIVKKFMISFVKWKENSFRLKGFLQYIKSK